MKKVLIITYYWPPCGGAGVQRTLKFARYLPDFGYLPYIITVDENKASYPVIDKTLLNDIPESVKVFRTGTSEPFALYSRLINKKDIPHSGFANESKPGVFQKLSRFIRGNIFIPDARKGWNKYAYKKAKELLAIESFAALITSSPPHSTQLLGLKLKKETFLPWIADLRDPWTDIYYYKEMMHLPFAKRTDAAFEKAVVENADEILVVSNAIKNIFVQKSDKINSGKIHIIPNGYDDEDFNIIPNPPGDKFLITYTGTLAVNYGVGNFIKSVAEVILLHKDINIRLRFVGEIAEPVKEFIKTAGIENYVEYFTYMPHKESVGYLLGSTALLMAIPHIYNNEGILTGKLFEYLASKKPIICIGPEHGDAAKIIEECEAGRTFGYEDKDNITAYLGVLIALWKKQPGIDNKKQAYNIYSRKNQAKELSRIIDALQ